MVDSYKDSGEECRDSHDVGSEVLIEGGEGKSELPKNKFSTQGVVFVGLGPYILSVRYCYRYQIFDF